MDLTEKTIKVESVFKGRILSVDVETVELPDGKIGTREIVRHPGAVAILPIEANGDVILVRQYRKPLNQAIWEIPAGKLEVGENPLECAKRELAEEIKKSAITWEPLISVWTAPGFTNEMIHLFKAEGLANVEAEADEDEFLEIESFSPEKLNEMIHSGEIQDTKTINALLYSGVVRI